MRRQEAWGTLRHLVVEGSPQQAATMLSALLLGYADHGRDRAALLCEVAFAQLMADEADAALSTARLAMEESTHPRCADAIGPRAQAAATLALALAVRGPSSRYARPRPWPPPSSRPATCCSTSRPTTRPHR